MTMAWSMLHEAKSNASAGKHGFTIAARHTPDLPLCSLVHVLRQCVLMKLPVNLEVGRSGNPQRFSGRIDSLHQSADWLVLSQGNRTQLVATRYLEGMYIEAPIGVGSNRSYRLQALDMRGVAQLCLQCRPSNLRELAIWSSMMEGLEATAELPMSFC